MKGLTDLVSIQHFFNTLNPAFHLLLISFSHTYLYSCFPTSVNHPSRLISCELITLQHPLAMCWTYMWSAIYWHPYATSSNDPHWRNFLSVNTEVCSESSFFACVYMWSAIYWHPYATTSNDPHWRNFLSVNSEPLFFACFSLTACIKPALP